MKGSVKKCKFCGKPINIITWGIYRKVVVDAEAVIVRADPGGEEFVRIDGSKVKAVEVPYMPEDGETGEPAYRMHGRSCDRRPS